jgi:nucleoside-diphosphate-sugar epimerase
VVQAHVWRPDDGVGLSPAGMKALMGATHVLNSVPPNGDFDRDPVLADAACADALIAAAASSGRFPAAAATAASTSLRWVAYLSSTGVYGDKGGGYVDESTTPSPISPKGIARYAAEEAWRELFDLHGVPVVVFRLGGIYGPGRSILDTVAAQAKVAKSTAPAESGSQRARGSRKFTSRCHVGDVVAVLCASIAQTAEGAAEVEGAEMRVYNVVDDEPAPRADAAAYARKLLHLDTDDEDDGAGGGGSDGADGAAGAESARGEKRVRNDRIKDELGVTLLYPTYREGLAAIADGDKTPFE